MVAPLDLMVGTILRCPITRAIEIRTGMTGIEVCSVSPRSHPLVDSANGQSWPAIAMQCGWSVLAYANHPAIDWRRVG
jgi:hypothetical protein